jgi:hypothetical protein
LFAFYLYVYFGDTHRQTQSLLVGNIMTIQPEHHWKFEKGNQTIDSIKGKSAKFDKIAHGKHGQIGFAVTVPGLGTARKVGFGRRIGLGKTRRSGKAGRIDLGKDVGQFGTKDFTIAFGMMIINTNKQKDLNIISSRNVMGHGNWFSLRQQSNQLTFEVDENNKGKHYAIAKTMPILIEKKWFHIAIVRKGPNLKIYHNGILVAEGKAKSNGIANIKNNTAAILGTSIRNTPTAKYEDLRIYHQALSEEEIEALCPQTDRLLKIGEVELTAPDGTKRLFNADDKDLFQYTNRFEKLRLGPDTGATLYKESNFSGTSQKLYSGIPQIQQSRVKTHPRSLHIWRSSGEPFQGQWVIRSANGQFLSWNRTRLKTAKKCSQNELFTINFNQNYGELQLIPVTDSQGSLFNIQGEPSPLIINDTESSDGAFSIEHKSGAFWLQQNKKGKFIWTPNQEHRTLFFRIAKFADHESKVGKLSEGEVALYEHNQYHGKVWILSDNSQDLAGNFSNLQKFFGLNNTTSSIRLGPDTGVTLFANENQQVNKSKRETEIEDFVENQPNLSESQLGNDNISSLKIFKRVSASELFASITSKLSQDYRMVGDKLEDFSAYRTILRLDPDVKEIEVSATDLTKIEVEDVSYEIDEVRSVTLKPNLLNQIMITSEADGIDTPALKFRTQDMAENERVVVSPAQEVHKQIAELKDDALWNAKDAQGNLIVDQKKHTKAEVASVQNTIKRVMSSVTVEQETATDANDLHITNSPSDKTAGTKLIVDTDNKNPWSINFVPEPGSTTTSENSLHKNTTQFSRSSIQASSFSGAVQENKTLTNVIHEESVSQREFNRLLSQANSTSPANSIPITPTSSSVVALRGIKSLRSIGRVFRGIRDTVKKATKVVIGFANNVMNAIIEIAGKVVRFVLDTVQKVAEFVQAVVEKVVKSIKQFVEFLRFLFDWKDILKTQRFIKNSINSAFDSAAEFVESAKTPISEAIGSIQNTVSNSIDGVIESLGVDPDDVAIKKSNLPEAAEWFLNKLFGSIGPGKPSLLAEPQNVFNSETNSGAIGHLKSALSKLVTMAGVTMTTGLVDTIEAVINNPTRPELALATMLSLVKELSIQTLDITEDLMMAVLDAIVAAIKLFQSLLNATIRIPLISALFKLIGAGELSIINVITILVAIPTTVVSKLMFGERPFVGLDVPQISAPQISTSQISEPQAAQAQLTTLEQAPILDTVASSTGILQNSAVVNADITLSKNLTTARSVQANDLRTRHRQLVKGFGAVSIHADIFSGLLSALLDAIPEKSDAQGKNGTFIVEVFVTGLDWLSWLGSFPASPNNPGGFPYLVHKHKVNIEDNPAELWHRVMWGYRTFVLSLDTIYLAAGLVNSANTVKIPARVNTSGLAELASALNISGGKNKLSLQRLKRGTEATMGIQLVLASVDLILTSIYLSQLPKGKGLRAANEIVNILPNMLGLLRLSPKGAAALGFIQLGKTIANYGMGVELLNKSVRDLQ